VTVSNTPASGMGATALTIPAIGASLGTLQIETPEPIPLHVRGGMPEGESLDIDLSGNEVVERFTIAGPWEHPLFVGSSTLSNGFFTYPLEGASDSDTLDADGGSFVENVNWQVDLVSGPNLTYETRSTQTLWRGLMRDPIELLGSMAAEMEARLSEGGRVELRGIYADSSLSIITDNLVSDQGRMSVLDIDFRPDGPLVLDWDTRADPEPLIRGRGVAEVEIDQDAYGEPDAGSGSLSRERQYQKIYARLVSVDPLTGVVREGGRLGELRVELDTDASRQGPVGERQQLAVLRMLGYHAPVLGEQDYDPAESQSIDPKDIVTAGYRTLLRRSEQQAWRSLFYPFRRQIRKLTRIDVVEVEPSFVLNLLDRDTYSRQELTPEQAYLTYLQGTNWTVGEYVWGRFLLSYHGELELTSIARPTIGARHEIGVEWAISPQTRLELSRDIDVPIGEPDTRIGLSHRFAFQSY